MNKSQKTWLIAGIVAAVVLVCCCAAGIGGYAWWANPSPERVTNKFLEALQDKDASAARDLTCASKRASVDVPDSDEELLGWDITSSTQAGDSATVIARVQTSEDGKKQYVVVTFTMVKEDGDWLMCGSRGRPE